MPQGPEFFRPINCKTHPPYVGMGNLTYPISPESIEGMQVLPTISTDPEDTRRAEIWEQLVVDSYGIPAGILQTWRDQHLRPAHWHLYLRLVTVNGDNIQMVVPEDVQHILERYAPTSLFSSEKAELLFANLSSSMQTLMVDKWGNITHQGIPINGKKKSENEWSGGNKHPYRYYLDHQSRACIDVELDRITYGHNSFSVSAGLRFGPYKNLHYAYYMNRLIAMGERSAEAFHQVVEPVLRVEKVS